MHLYVKDGCSFSQAQTTQIQSMLINFNGVAVDRNLKTRQASVNTEGEKKTTQNETPVTSLTTPSHAHTSDQCSYSSNNLPESAVCQ